MTGLRLGSTPISRAEHRFLRSTLERARRLDNTLRGIYAEEVVASQLPGAVLTHEWGGWDIDWEGIAIEVKTSGRVQSWHGPTTPSSRLTWAVPERFAWDAQTDSFCECRRRHADVYVLCRHSGHNLNDGWAFYVLPTRALDELDQGTLGITTAERLAGEAIRAKQLPNAVRTAGVVR